MIVQEGTGRKFSKMLFTERQLTIARDIVSFIRKEKCAGTCKSCEYLCMDAKTIYCSLTVTIITLNCLISAYHDREVRFQSAIVNEPKDNL